MQSLVLGSRYAYRVFVAGLIDDIKSINFHSVHSAPIQRPLSLVTASSGISKAPIGSNIVSKWCFGDDAYFVAKNTVADVIGVADGVGGWRSYGVDPSQFPRSLMSICERLVSNGHFRPQEPVDILSKGYDEILENKSPLIGSCTACLVALDKEDKTLYSANLGDSGFLVIRRGSVVHRSEEQQHYFNTPFQLSVAPSVLEGQVLADSPDSAQTSSFNVQDGDIILVGTDGLFDNLSDDMILHHVSKLKGSKEDSVQTVANLLADKANELAFDENYMSPFALHAAANGYSVKGGKPDDITVVLARVTDEGLEVT